METSSSRNEAEINRVAHLGRVAERLGRIRSLRTLLTADGRDAILTALEQQGYINDGNREEMSGKDLAVIRADIEVAISKMEAYNDEVPGLARAVQEGLVSTGTRTDHTSEAQESLEDLSDEKRTCLETMQRDLNHLKKRWSQMGQPEKDAYLKVFQDPSKLSWEAVQSRLLANEATLLKKSVELSKLTDYPDGGCTLLVGVYPNGEIAIRQRSSEIVNVIQDKEGALKLVFHKEAKLQEGDKWGKAVEINRAIKQAGFHLPPDAPNYEKEGLIAAYEALAGQPYVKSLDGTEWRDAMLECPDNAPDSASVRVVRFDPYARGTGVNHGYAGGRGAGRGAVLWLRG